MYCGQTVGWITIPLGTEVGLGPGDIVLDGDPAPPTERGTVSPPLFGHVYCVQTVAHLSNCWALVRAHFFDPPYTHTHNYFTALFPGWSGWAGPRRGLLDFVVQGKISRGRHRPYLAGCHSIRTNQWQPPPSPIFYRLDALPAAQPTVLKHWRTDPPYTCSEDVSSRV